MLIFRGPESASRAAGAVGAIVVLALLGLALISVWQLRVQAMSQARSVAEDHAMALAEHAKQVMSAADFVADGVARMIEARHLKSDDDLAAYFGNELHQQLLAARQASFDAIDAVSVFDRHGRLLSSSRAYPPPEINVADTEAFALARGQTWPGPHIAGPIRSRITGEWTFYMVRRLTDDAGGFEGMVTVGLSPRYFSRFYAALRLDRAQPREDITSMTLLRGDGTVLARAPLDEDSLGQRVSRRGAYGQPALQPEAAPGVFEPWDASPEMLDHLMLVARQVDGFPLVVTVAARDELYLADWQRQARGVAWFAGAATLFLVGTFSTLVQVLRRRERHLQDVERLRAAAEQASRAKSNFLATVSHEVRTPLNGILGTAELLVQAPLGPREQQWARTLLASGRNLLSIINDILDLTKIEADEIEIDVAPFDPRAMLRDVLSLFAPYAAGKGLALTLHVDDDVPPAVAGDAKRVKQVLGNLVGNAIKFSDRGEVHVELRAMPDGGRAGLLRFEVHDHGVGIPPEARDRIFQPFMQADSTISRRFGGTGLGLAISRRLVMLMGGSIDFDSEPDRGTRFRVDLPLPAAAGPAADPQPHQHSDWTFAHSGAMPLAAPSPGPHGGRVLVVEDNEVNALVVEAQLERLGRRCDIAADGEEALHRLCSGDYELVLMDCMLPGISGFEVTRRWREMERSRDLPHLPIVALTANALASNVEEARAAGMDDFLTKPCTLDKLEAVLRRWPVQAADPSDMCRSDPWR
ncbi:ATP-binding protein [Ideonella sp. YS5]|uniref:hybrid sensor histidine kinase/response regulator n=1 Tax=Ideonella sp. YS5 TaxID=3453714 RepID=UPI003F7230B0